MKEQKTLEELYEEVKQKFLDKEIRYLNRMLSFDDNPGTPEEIADREAKEKDEMKEINTTKARLKYIESLLKERGRQQKKQESDDENEAAAAKEANEELEEKKQPVFKTIKGKIKHIPKSFGEIVTKIPTSKSGT